MSVFAVLGVAAAALAMRVADAPKSRYAARLENMMNAVVASESTIALVGDPAERTLLRGVAAAVQESDVVDAFTILYEDLAPIRLAGDLIFRTLHSRVLKARDGQDELRRVITYSDSEVVAARRLFDLVDSDSNGAIDREELLASGLLSSVGHCEGCTCESMRSCVRIEEIMEEMDRDGDEKISFQDFMLAASRFLYVGDDIEPAAREQAQRLLCEMGALTDGCDVDEVAEAEAARAMILSSKQRAASSERFDEMLLLFSEWERSSSDAVNGSRLGKVLKGCFTGAKKPRIVAALKLAYTNYRPLRLMGDLIFRLMRSLVDA